MNRRHLLRLAAACATVAWTLTGPAAMAQGNDASYGDLLARYVRPSPDGINRVDYPKWAASAEDKAKLKGYIADLAGRTPSKMQREEAFAYWANLYNAITLQVVLDRYPVSSIRDIKSEGLFDPKAYTGPWRTKRVKVEGREYSLDDIENDVMRPTYKDPRVHYSVNCASLGCPNLPTKPWAAATLDASLDAAARDFVNHPRGVAVIGPKKLKVSSIYKWFKDDFGGDAGVLAHLRKYAGPKLLSALDAGATIAEDNYDWALAGVARQAGKS